MNYNSYLFQDNAEKFQIINHQDSYLRGANNIIHQDVLSYNDNIEVEIIQEIYRLLNVIKHYCSPIGRI